MILVVAPEQPIWLPSLLAHDELDLDPAHVQLVTIPTFVRRSTTLWARGRADRRLAGRFWLRHLADRRATRRVAPTTTVVCASSCAAQRVFAAARRRDPSVRCVLVEDLPDLRRLHADLDQAAAAHPEARFLRRYRASRAEIARQQAERVLADTIVVRGRHAYEARVEDGVDTEHLVALVGDLDVDAAPRPVAATPVVLLGGLAAARSGLFEALALVDQLPDIELVVRVGEGLEPADALARARVRAGTSSEISSLDGIDLVIAPSWCETDLPQLVVAARRGVPIVATSRASGFLDASAVRLVYPGDVAALVDAVRSAIAR
ncbi:MAG: hypothetical protein V7636_631 [Actinomycetota bacterium]